MIVNKFPNKCQSCSVSVPVGAGFAYKNGNRWLTVCNSSACIRRLGLNVPEPSNESRERKLSAIGKITMPYDKLALPFLRSMPGAKWNPTEKCWFVSTLAKDLPRVIELADKLQLDVDSKLRELMSEGTPASREAKQRASRDGLYEFQRAGVEFLALHDKALLSDEQGLGKTIEALVALPSNARTIVICPASVKYNWRDEIRKWRPEFNVEVLSGRESFKVPNDNEIVISNFDILPSWLVPSEKNVPVIIPPEFSELKSSTLVVDECHKTKNYQSRRAQKIKELSRVCVRTWFLSGTPLLNRPFDLFGVLSSGNMARDVFGSWNKFMDLFHGFKNKWGGYDFPYAPEPEVAERLRRIMLRRLVREVMPDLPSKRYQDITVNDITGELYKKMDEIYEDMDDDEEDLPDFEEFSKIRAMLASARIPAMLEIVESYEDSETPLIVFSAHRAPILTLKEREGWAVITGDTKSEDRRNIVHDFQNCKLKGIGLTIQAGGEGITLTRASHLLFIDLDWTPAMNLQAESRALRIGQQANCVLVQRLVSSHPLDRHVHALICKKMILIEQAIEKLNSFNPPRNIKQAEIKEETDEELKARLAAIDEAAKQVEIDLAKSKISSILSREIAKSEVPEPELTSDRKRLIRQALSYMCNRCDGAVKKDGQGFSKPDAAIAHWVNATGLEESDDITFRVTERILSRYYGQLHGLYDAIWQPTLD